MTALWAKKEKEIEKVVLNISGMYGDLQELTDGSMPAIQAFELSLLEEATEEA
jgi:hypothetical protein